MKLLLAIALIPLACNVYASDDITATTERHAPLDNAPYNDDINTPQNDGSADVEACTVNYDNPDGNNTNPCDSLNPCWQYQTGPNDWLPKGYSCEGCVCATRNTNEFGQVIKCGCNGICRFGGCMEPK